MGQDDEKNESEGPFHRPLPHVDMPLLREERVASRRRRAAVAAAIAILLLGSAASGAFWWKTHRVTAPADAGVPDASAVAFEAPSVDASVPESVDAAIDAAPSNVRVEAPGEHAGADGGRPVTEGATTRTTSRFGNSPAFRSALTNAGLSGAEAAALEQALNGVLDFRRCRPEHQLVVERDASRKLLRFEYRSGVTDYVAVTRDANGALRGHRVHVPVERVRLVRAGRVQGSLGDSLEAAGLGSSLVSAFVEAFQGRADFNSDTRTGDVFRVVVDEERIHGQFLRYAKPVGLIYDGGGTGHLEAYYFEAPGMRGQYYDVEGRELHGGWLVTPCRYDHLSSPFNPRRLHPILRRIQPHNGVDFSAQTGTPVWAAAAGTVTWAGPKGPNGNLVAITHGGGYQSFYAHLHRIQPGITRGVHVNQRQLIGQVGTTGRSTGPHLHFGLKHGSQFVDPMGVLNGPGRMLPAPQLAHFRRTQRAAQREMLAAALGPVPASRPAAVAGAH